MGLQGTAMVVHPRDWSEPVFVMRTSTLSLNQGETLNFWLPFIREPLLSALLRHVVSEDSFHSRLYEPSDVKPLNWVLYKPCGWLMAEMLSSWSWHGHDPQTG